MAESETPQKKPHKGEAAQSETAAAPQRESGASAGGSGSSKAVDARKSAGQAAAGQTPPDQTAPGQTAPGQTAPGTKGDAPAGAKAASAGVTASAAEGRAEPAAGATVAASGAKAGTGAGTQSAPAGAGPAPDAPRDTHSGAEAKASESPSDAKRERGAGESRTPGSAAGRAGTTPAAPASPPPPRRRGGGAVWGFVLGGILAAVLGFAAARYLVPQGWPFGPSADRLNALSAAFDKFSRGEAARLDNLGARVTKLDGRVSALETKLGADTADRGKQAQAVTALQDAVSGLDGRVKSTETALGRIEARLNNLDKANAQGAGAATAVDSKALAALRDQLAAEQTRSADLAQKLSTLSQRVDTTLKTGGDQAATLRKAIDQTARRAAAESALGRIQSALQLGGGYAAAVKQIEAQGYTVPPALGDPAATGVASRDTLIAAWPDASRAALAASLKAEMGSGVVARLGAFLRVQTGLRALHPRPGNDPDAILSRAEADLRQGALKQSLQELSALPEPGRKAMAGWIARAQTRLDALEAANRLAGQISSK